MEREREEEVFDFYKLEQKDRAGQRERERGGGGAVEGLERRDITSDMVG